MNPCGEIPALSSVYLDWYFHPIERKTYDLTLSIKYSPTLIDIDFGDFESNDEKGNFYDGNGYDKNGHESEQNDRNINESKIDYWREREGGGGGGGEEGEGGEEKGGSAYTSFSTGNDTFIFHALTSTLYLIYCRQFNSNEFGFLPCIFFFFYFYFLYAML